jgi:hypothetical protein
MGRPITELTHEELLDAMSFAAQEIERLMKKNDHDRKFMFETFIQPNFKNHEKNNPLPL